MPKKAKELSATEVRNLSKPGLHAVGGTAGLLLQVSAAGARSWILRTMVGAKRRDIGLGGFPDVPLKAAREKAREIKEQIQQGVDPVLQRKANRSALIREQSKAVTFADLAQVYTQRKSKEFKTAKQTQKLAGHLERYALPYLGKMLVSDIEMAHVVAMLEPIWETKTETATRVRLSVEKILDIAIADKKRSGNNPAKWKGVLEHSSLPAPGKVSKVTHHAALAVDDMPTFWAKLQKARGMGARTLQFIILTACRSGEARGATWDEIDFTKKTWTVPAERMKGKKVHVVPLTADAINLLEQTPRLGKYLFTGGRGGQISDVMVSKVPKALGHNVTAHGFRSTFKDWARLHTAYPDEVSELAIAHVNSDKTRAAYARDGLLNKRRLLMNDWADYCNGKGAKVSGDNVVSIGGASQ
ncbi:tyrosine-type recombinase/integrase [Halopseudomonas pelagia]|uniref:tyrosine-type recombinase/integrase n=1 Tax=Halopseudomonas pelagia TaxID=553151 RepID=UPI0003A58CBA|nr:site-specific integrase [Halopseudomonas pelagia]